WTREMVATLIKRKCWPPIPLAGCWRRSASLVRSHCIARSNATSLWFGNGKAMAKKQGADIYFGDAAYIRSDHHAGRTWGAKGDTPIVQATAARHGMSLISAVTSRGHLRFMIIDKGSVNADVFIEFLKRLIKGASAFVQTLGAKLCLFFLPPYAPDRNPDELVWKHLKADTVGRMAVTSKEDFAKKVRRSMRDLQN